MQKYYHVVTERPVTLGQIITFDEQNVSGVKTRVLKQKETVDDIYKNPNKYKEIELSHEIKVALRELALEQVRKEKFPNYPSRLECLYVSKNLSDAYMWADSFIKGGRTTFSVVQLETDGNEFSGDAWNCFDGTVDKEENLKGAYDYWSNVPNKHNETPIIETLINGNIKVIKIIEKFN